MALDTDLTIYQGRYKEIDGIAKDDDGNVLSIASPVLLKFVVKPYFTDADSAAVLTKTSAVATEIRKIDDAAGTYRIYLQQADTSSLNGGQNYVYEVVYVDDPDAATPKPYTLNQGMFTINATTVDTVTS